MCFSCSWGMVQERASPQAGPERGAGAKPRAGSSDDEDDDEGVSAAAGPAVGSVVVRLRSCRAPWAPGITSA